MKEASIEEEKKVESNFTSYDPFTEKEQAFIKELSK